MRKALRWFQPILALVAAGFIVSLLWRQAPALRAMEWHLDPRWLAASALLMAASWAVEIRIWTALVKMLGTRLPYLEAARMWFLTAVVRYIPGNIWQPLSLTLYAQQQGVRPEVAVTSIVLYQIVTLVSVGPMAAAYLWFTGNWGTLFQAGGPGAATWPLLIALLVPVFGLLLLPHVALGLLNWMLERARRPRLQEDLGRGRLALVVLAAVCDWLLWGGTFATLTLGLTDMGAAEIGRVAPHLVFAFPIAYAIGFISFLLPSGFGVREGALYVLLAPILGGPLVTVAALSFRIWNMLGEIVMALLAWMAGRTRTTTVALADREPEP